MSNKYRVFRKLAWGSLALGTLMLMVTLVALVKYLSSGVDYTATLANSAFGMEIFNYDKDVANVVKSIAL